MYKMEPLDKSIRNKLEHVVVKARDIIESAARAALEQLGVGEAMPFAHLTEDERRLRRKLRVHGRQLGDIRNSRGEQEIGRLVEEVAYEHWHRMLFARFLADNNLLMYPDQENPVAITLEECEDLASHEDAQNGWELAARFATRMLPQIFRPDSPVFQIALPPEHQQKLERLVTNLPLEVFSSSDSLGWVYQFWQTKKKDEINASEVKIGARELPAVTQLFTEPYIVNFLLDNSLGAWWAARRLSKVDLNNAASEDELRAKAALPGMSLKYLRFVREDDRSWTPAAGAFDGWPEHLSEFKVLDPCCGSGHFLVAAFLMLVPLRMELEGLSARDAVEAVLRENIHGLELDQRCVELAAFALALTAWRYPKAGGYRQLPELNLACSGLAITAKKEEWIALAGDNTNLRMALEALYEQFKDAPVLGSLINPEIGLAKGSLFELKWDEVRPLLDKMLLGEKDDEKTEMGVVAQGITKAAFLLVEKYTWIITNVPYVGRGKQAQVLKDYIESHYNDAKFDIAYAFIDRCISAASYDGAYCVVMPQNWLFQNGSANHRRKILENNLISMIARLGEGAFESNAAAGAFTALYIFRNSYQAHSSFAGIDASAERTPAGKAGLLRSLDCKLISQSDQIKNPDSRIILSGVTSATSLIGGIAEAYQGLVTGDISRFVAKYWELSRINSDWRFVRGAVDSGGNGGLEDILLWEHGIGQLHEYAQLSRSQLHDMHESGNLAWGKHGVAINRVRNLRASFYWGEAFHNSIAVIIPLDESNALALFEYCASDQFFLDVRQIDGKLSVTNRTLLKVPFDLDSWTKVAQEKYPDGLPEPCSDDPTQWIFHGHPVPSDKPLQVAVARLLGYRWSAELDSAIELSNETRAWIKKSEALLSLADEDGIVCIPPVRGEASGADRLLNLLAAAYAYDWSNNKLAQLLKQANHAGKTLETWLRDKFFTQHCKLFHHRPFIWHIWDGLRDGFAALVNYHKLDAKLLESLIYTYLGDWISRQKQDKAKGVDGAEEKLVAAETLKKSLELILEGEAPYDIFVRWKPIEKQPIGWASDLNDGVRLNIRPFLTVPDIGRKGAGVLRDKPNINWNKDRGKDVKSAPWYHLGLQYGGREGDRINDHHLSLAEKRVARETKKMETK